MTRPVVGIGELLWDVFPDGRRVAGGAPFNFAFHCRQLGHAGTIVSRVGDDALGRELREEVRRLGMSDEYIQTDPDRPTGTVQVTLDAAGVPAYRITEGVAWDAIEWTPALGALAGEAGAVCHGTLAQRADTSCETVQTFLRECRFALRVFDVNLRQHYYSKPHVTWSLARSHTIKLNVDELATLADLFGWPGTTDAERVAGLFRISAARTCLVVLTRGADGCTVYPERGKPESAPAPLVKIADTVGAGDAFTAAMVCLQLEGKPLRESLRFALQYAARVCEHRGATPRIDRAEVERAALGTP
ncbi:MAG: carbohydrate kinase [Gemmataceae bacterium]